jgi:hypothetical protein
MNSLDSDRNTAHRLFEKVTMNFGEEQLGDAVFLDIVKAFDTVWADGLVWKLTVLNFPSYLKTISSYLRGRTCEACYQAATFSRRGMQAGVAQGGLISPVLLVLPSTLS